MNELIVLSVSIIMLFCRNKTTIGDRSRCGYLNGLDCCFIIVPLIGHRIDVIGDMDHRRIGCVATIEFKVDNRIHE